MPAYGVAHRVGRTVSLQRQKTPPRGLTAAEVQDVRLTLPVFFIVENDC